MGMDEPARDPYAFHDYRSAETLEQRVDRLESKMRLLENDVPPSLVIDEILEERQRCVAVFENKIDRLLQNASKDPSATFNRVEIIQMLREMLKEFEA